MMATTAQLLLDEPSEDVSPRRIAEPPTQLQPEKRLMLAVLQGAVRDFQTYATAPSGRGRQIFIEADAWFQAAATGAFTFEMICDALGLDPDFIRGGLRRWYRERRRRPTFMSRAVAAPRRAGAPVVGPLGDDDRGVRELNAADRRRPWHGWTRHERDPSSIGLPRPFGRRTRGDDPGGVYDCEVKCNGPGHGPGARSPSKWTPAAEDYP
jgi:hypothetical protein